MGAKRKVEEGYDRIAEKYLAARNPDDPRHLADLEEWGRTFPPGGVALDLGCGAGVPVARWLAWRFAVTGVDVSARQVDLARRHVPGATFIKADMAGVDFPTGSFDVVVAFWSIIHVPRAEQPALVGRIHGWLNPGGAFLANWATTAWEGEEEDWEGRGAAMWWSHYGAEENLGMLRAAGFEIERAETVSSGGETWLWVLARKGGL
ncbi:MAG: class I SAM-dependent methyltransferase [Chloroflexota bacterium]|nr:class I SAM-dependent methyltransferase [Chloroflexota bacterium]